MSVAVDGGHTRLHHQGSSRLLCPTMKMTLSRIQELLTRTGPALANSCEWKSPRVSRRASLPSKTLDCLARINRIGTGRIRERSYRAGTGRSETDLVWC